MAEHRRRTHGPARDDGSATVVALGLLVVATLPAVAASATGAAVLTRHRAAAAADAAALSAALAAATGTGGSGGGPCADARSAAARDGADLTGCSVVDGVADVQVVVHPPPVLAGFGVARLNARAGPAETIPEKP